VTLFPDNRKRRFVREALAVAKSVWCNTCNFRVRRLA
jgi:hypothetical protein